MNILLVAKLSDNSFNCILQPLLRSDYIHRIYVLRDTQYKIDSGKVIFLTKNIESAKGIYRHFLKIREGRKVCKMYHIDLIIGVLIYPHGYIGKLISLFTRLPYIHVTIAGQREFWLHGKLVEWFNILIFRSSKTITVTGQTTRSYLLRKKIEEEKIQILPNVIDMEKYKDSNNHRDFDIISLSRLDKNKNVSLLLKAIAKIKNIRNVNVLIVGDGPEMYNLRKEAESLDIQDNVFFKGWVKDLDRKVEYFNQSKIYVLCSKGEGFPLALLEAMACGCVPVITNVGDISDVIFNGENGYLLSNHSEEELSLVLLDLLNDSKKIEAISDKVKEVKKKYSFEAISKIWNNILQLSYGTT